MVYIFTGNGKGKTTAALGQALRAVGGGRRVLMVQFIKGPLASGEDESHKKLWPAFEIRKRGRGFVGILGDKLPRGDHELAAQKALSEAKSEIESGRWHIVILDEINVALGLELLGVDSVLEVVRAAKAKNVHLILTGRGIHDKLADAADLVTEMVDIKHPFDRGTKAKLGIEY